MEQNRPLLVTSEDTIKLPILIVDKKGVLGESLTKILRDQFLVVVVTSKEIDKHDNVIRVPYRRKIPLIPDNTYSHLFIMYNGESELLHMLASFEEKAEAVKARFFFVTSLLYSSPKLLATLQKPEYRLLQPVLFGEIFNNAITEANEINFFIHQARVYGRIEVPGEGLGNLYPVLFDDVLTSLVSLAFSFDRIKKPIFLFPRHEFNEIALAHCIQKIEPIIKVDFIKRKSSVRHFYIPRDGYYFFHDYNIEEKLHKIDLTRTGHRAKLPQKQIRLHLPHSPYRQSRTKMVIAILLAVFVAPLIVDFSCAVLGAGLLSLSAKQLETGDLQTATSQAALSQIAFSTAKGLGPSLILPQLFVPVQRSKFLDMMQTGETVAATEVSFLQAVSSMKNIYEGKSFTPRSDFLQSLAAIKNDLLTLQKLDAEGKLPNAVLQRIHKISGLINLSEETIDTWPNILGFEGKKVYLILFQNNMELRPGGGFIGSYGILPIENGRTGKLQIQDVYDADGQLTQHVQPPYGLQRYLGVSHWFLRDSNFDPDFPTSAQQAAQLLKKETGQNVDGVIAIDTTFLKNLISVFGSVVVPDYNVTVTPDNFYLLTETYAEKNFFPGSTQKKDFLRSLSNALFDKLAIEKHIPYEQFANLIVDSIRQKDIVVAFSDTGVQNYFTVNGLSSSLWDGRMAQKTSVDDFFGVVDANVGTNKANFYIKRSMSQSTVIEDRGSLQTTAEVTYANTSTKTSSFGGDYKDYLRFLVPANATLTSVAFDNKQVQTAPAITDPAIFTSPDFTPPPALEVDQTEEMGKKVIGFFFIVPVGVIRTVSITYTVPGNLENNTVSFVYNLKLFKEPGTGDDLYALSLAYPNDFRVVTSDPGLTDVGGKLLFDGQLSEDRSLSASFSKK